MYDEVYNISRRGIVSYVFKRVHCCAGCRIGLYRPDGKRNWTLWNRFDLLKRNARRICYKNGRQLMMKELNDIDEGNWQHTYACWMKLKNVYIEPPRDGINDKRKSFLSYDANIQFRYINYANNIIKKRPIFSLCWRHPHAVQTAV